MADTNIQTTKQGVPWFSMSIAALLGLSTASCITSASNTSNDETALRLRLGYAAASAAQNCQSLDPQALQLDPTNAYGVPRLPNTSSSYRAIEALAANGIRLCVSDENNDPATGRAAFITYRDSVLYIDRDQELPGTALWLAADAAVDINGRDPWSRNFACSKITQFLAFGSAQDDPLNIVSCRRLPAAAPAASPDGLKPRF